MSDTRDQELVKIEIFNIKGQHIREFKIENLKLKINSVIWDGTDTQNKPVSSGIYFCVLMQGDRLLSSRKMMLLK